MNAVQKTAIQMALRLGIFALVCTFFLALVYQVSYEKIDANVNLLKTAKLAETLPQSIEYDNDLSSTYIKLTSKQAKEAEKIGVRHIYAATKQGKIQGVIVDTIAPNGYSGKINLLVGILANGQITGVRVVAQKETVGLGDYIVAEKSSWSEQFKHFFVKDRIKVKKDGGQIEYRAGATVSARAVTQSVDKAALFFFQNQSDMKVTHE